MTAVAGNIFISYRRSDSTKDARALYERLRREFGEQRVFIDLEGIGPGEDFVELLERKLEGCEVLVALIGPGWAEARSERGERRLHDADDFVRIELRAALTRGIKVFPVLIDGALPPRADQLPDDLQPLVRRQAIVLDYTKFEADVARLVQAIRSETERKVRGRLPYVLGAFVVVGAIALLATRDRTETPGATAAGSDVGRSATGHLAPPKVPGPATADVQPGASPPAVTNASKAGDILRKLKAANLSNSVGDRALAQWLTDSDRHYSRLAEGCLKLIGSARLSAEGADLDKINALYLDAIGLKGDDIMAPDHDVDAKKLARAIVDAYNNKNGSSATALSQVLR